MYMDVHVWICKHHFYLLSEEFPEGNHMLSVNVWEELANDKLSWMIFRINLSV